MAEMTLEQQRALALANARLRAQKAQATQAPAEPSALEKAKGFGYGAVTGLVGGPGELEEFVTYTGPELVGLRERGAPKAPPATSIPGVLRSVGALDRPTVFPTVKDVGRGLEAIGIQPPREDVSGYQTAGEVIGGLGTSIPGILRSGTRAILGVPSKTSAKLAERAEDLGFKLSPSQVRQDVPVGQYGAVGFAKENQDLANKLATKGTGKEAAEVTPDFLRDRFSDLGRQYDALYIGKQFPVDPSVQNALNNILMKEQELGVAGVSTVKQAAQTILDKFQVSGPVIDGVDLQRLRNAITERARSTASRGNAHEIYEMVNVIDNAVAARNPSFKKTLDVLSPQYRNTIILEDLYRQGGIHQGNISLEKLGNMLAGKRDAVRRTGKDIDELGELGRELQIRARWQEAGTGMTPSTDILRKALGTTPGGAVTAILRGRPARALQRGYAEEAPGWLKAVEGAGMVPAAGTVTRPLKREE